MKKIILFTICVILKINVIAQQLETVENNTHNSSDINFFIAYDFGEAAFNRFQSLSGEIGVSLPNKHLIRLVHMNVNLTEEHLKSDFVTTVEGENVEGKMLGLEAFYSFPLIKWQEDNQVIYLSPSLGAYKNKYWHTELDENLEQSSFTTGVELSYRETNPFKTKSALKGLYYTVSIPLRVHFNPHEKTQLGNTTISKNTFDNNIWFFMGYQF
ncbi:hypothetical protein [Sediminitomix flava]|uniref:Outer membrane protein with beta-barrel domain n=1 Tax=Sediminitomix flava TaxID=379075 RepID=A0A315ZC48_SEDFL|nr:hypothetical protein [Sediminitomix flava]PWJ42673.1 hypothetical protein BC781_102218 [Sediminitomix flava]